MRLIILQDALEIAGGPGRRSSARLEVATMFAADHERKRDRPAALRRRMIA
jgi:hypothetical protein